MKLKVIVWAIIATSISGWWLPHVNTGLRYTTTLILVGYTGIAAILALRNTVFRQVAAVCAAGSIGLVFAPAWMIPVVAMPVIMLTGAYLYVGAYLIRHYMQHGQLPPLREGPFEGDDQRDDQPTDSAPSQSPRHHSRQMEPDLDTDSLTFETKRPPHER